jgi:hypothetical protein
MRDLKSYLRSTAKYPLLLWLIAALALVVSIGLCWLAFQQHRSIEQGAARNNKLLALQATTNLPVLSQADQINLKRWSQLTMERDFPWPAIFTAVEKAASPEIELLQFRPDKPNRSIALSGEAKNHKALVIYLSALAAQPALKNVYLLHLQTVQRGTLETIAFEIRATLVN